MQRISLSWASVPAEYLRSKRARPSARAVLAILRATVSGAPTCRAPCSTSRSKAARALGADAVVHHLVALPVFVARLRVAGGDMAGRMHRDRLRRPTELSKGAVVEIDIGPEARGVAADDGERQREVVARSAHHRFRAAADADPDAQRTAVDRREYALVLQRRPRLALPGHGVAADQRGKQLELLLEQQVVVGEVVAEQWKGFGEGAAPERHLSATVGGGVERGEALEHPHGIVGRQH